MPEDIVAQHHLLPEMKLLEVRRGGHGGWEFVVCMTSAFETGGRQMQVSGGKAFGEAETGWI